MKSYDVNSRHHTEMHCFSEGATVVEWDDPHKTERVVVSVSGQYKDDHIQLDSKNTPWMIAGNYKAV